MILPLLLSLTLSEEGVRCNLKALTADERKQHSTAFHQLLPTFTERRELKDGIHLGGSAVPLPLLAEWIARERRCCPFLHFTLDLAPEQGLATLTIRGPKGTRKLLREGFARKD
jgi:hypothetical protein